MDSDIKQFILSNGDEIICQVVEWADDVEVDMVVRRAYKIVTVDDPIKGMRFYTVRPWLLMQSGNDVFNTINSQHIIAEGNPTEELLVQYRRSIDESEMDQEELMNQKVDRAAKRFKEIQDKITSQIEVENDSSTSNVIYFGNHDKDKLH